MGSGRGGNGLRALARFATVGVVTEGRHTNRIRRLPVREGRAHVPMCRAVGTLLPRQRHPRLPDERLPRNPRRVPARVIGPCEGVGGGVLIERKRPHSSLSGRLITKPSLLANTFGPSGGSTCVSWRRAKYHRLFVGHNLHLYET